MCLISDGQRHLDAVCNDRFWIFTDLNMVTVLADKHDSIMQNRNPAPPMLF